MKLALVFALSLHAPRDGWFGPDKVQHFFISAFVQSLGYASLRATNSSHQSSLLGATAASAAIGVGKELRDRRVTRLFSLRDLTWDAAGIGASTLMLEHTQR